MIIRRIILDESELDNFDYFNDYADTRNYLHHLLLSNDNEDCGKDTTKERLILLGKLERGYAVWLYDHTMEVKSRCGKVSDTVTVTPSRDEEI